MLITVDDLVLYDTGADTCARTATYTQWCRQLEEGHILFLPRAPAFLKDEERVFLLNRQHVVAAFHKHIAYWPGQDRVTGCATAGKHDVERLRAILRAYSLKATQLLQALLPPYAGWLRLDSASFRPEEEQGRNLGWQSRNDLLHTDAFPSRPTNGARILRMFTNINPMHSRRWITTDNFEVLAKRFASSDAPQLQTLCGTSTWQRARRGLRAVAHSAGLPLVPRSPYDDFMLRFHDFLKRNREFQDGCPKQVWDFPPDSTWIAFTDVLPHAALSGQYALEQTFIVPRHAMLMPEKAPVTILESLFGRPLTDPLSKRKVSGRED